MKIERLRGKKIALLGFGVENISLAKFLLKQKIDFVVLDKADIEDLLEEAQSIIKNQKLEVISGNDYLSHLGDFDIVVRSPGVKFLTTEIQNLRKKGREVTSSTKLFFEFCPARIIGVTGTKGKGTTASLITDILKKGLKSKIYLVGNIGLPSFDIIEDVRENDLVVFELSSFQLQDMEVSPWIAVIVNLTDDHMDYHQTLAEYRATKRNILKYQKQSDFAVLNYDYPESKKLEKFVKGHKYFFSSKEQIKNGSYVDENGRVILSIDGDNPICSASEIKLLGRHNLENIAAASLVGSILKVGLDDIRKAVIEFNGLPHRLEFIRDVEGIKFYNDSFSTNPTPTIAAINAFSSPLTIILGGSEKGADFLEMAKVIKGSSVKNVLTIGLEGPKIKRALEKIDAKVNIIKGGNNINDIVEKAFKISEPGEVVLFSPACASFDMFKNYKDRGEKFKQAVKDL
ncbi:MAG: UDP-N-acetylmuramoyl-L-alanine--D-glutamate ligase [Patescibacteria group bacterium]|jgi:UDP-N-acetylmuramoylalanine--D-glutamate ligase